MTKKCDQLKNSIKPPMTKSLVGLMLCKIVSANQLISGFLNSCANLRHLHNHLGKRRFLHLHRKNKMSTKRPQTAGKKLLHRIVTADERSRLYESCKISIFGAARGRKHPYHGLDESFVNSADKFFGLGNHCPVSKAPYRRTSDYPNHWFIYSAWLE
jgi:hypothetical protein